MYLWVTRTFHMSSAHILIFERREEKFCEIVAQLLRNCRSEGCFLKKFKSRHGFTNVDKIRDRIICLLYPAWDIEWRRSKFHLSDIIYCQDPTHTELCENTSPFGEEQNMNDISLYSRSDYRLQLGLGGKLITSQSSPQGVTQSDNATYLKRAIVHNSRWWWWWWWWRSRWRWGLFCPHPPQSKTHNVREPC